MGIEPTTDFKPVIGFEVREEHQPLLRFPLGVAVLVLGVLSASCQTMYPKPSKQDVALTKAAAAKSPNESAAPESSGREPASIGSEKSIGQPGEIIDSQHLRSQADYHFTLAEAHSLEGDADRAIEEYKLTLIYDPDSASVRLKLATELVRKGQLVQAVDQAEMAVKLAPKNPDALLLLGGLCTSSKL